jgi:hypothetical protein
MDWNTMRNGLEAEVEIQVELKGSLALMTKGEEESMVEGLGAEDCLQRDRSTSQLIHFLQDASQNHGLPRPLCALQEKRKCRSRRASPLCPSRTREI